MRIRTTLVYVALAGSSLLLGQDSGSALDIQGLRQTLAQDRGSTSPSTDTTPKTSLLMKTDSAGEEARRLEMEKIERLVLEAKRHEGAPRRFAADLFEVRQYAASHATEGGVSEEYVLGAGDILQLNVFGSATFDVPLSVDGKGEVVIPKVGTVKVAGMSLARARQAVQGKVGEQFSRTTAALTVIKLREVRVFVLGDVYKPGSFLVPSLSSLVNVLSLAGGPTLLGSFRDVRLIRGGKVIHHLDLYPLRADGQGNPNVYLQNGDTLFIPLAQTQVSLEGGFTRVSPPRDTQEGALGLMWEMPWHRRKDVDPFLHPSDKDRNSRDQDSRSHQSQVSMSRENLPFPDPRGASEQGRQDPEGGAGAHGKGGAAPSRDSRPNAPSGSQREAHQEPRRSEGMLFELRPNETAADVLRFAGGLTSSAHGDRLSLRRVDASGLLSIQDVPVPLLDRTTLQKGDVLSALPRRERLTRFVTVAGWTRVPGAFARPDGLRVGALLRRDNQILPDTYLQRGDIVRTREDGGTQLLSFSVEKALSGDPTHDLELSDRDRIELFPLQRMKLPRTVTLNGPFTLAGTYELHEGMRITDLLFKAGIPQKQANTLSVELARCQYGKPSTVTTLDLARLLSSEKASPLDLQDEHLNPLLRGDDVVTVFEKPEFRVHRTVRISGQVARPGTFVLDREHATLSQLLERAGGITPEGMPSAGIFLRNIGDTVSAGLEKRDTQLGSIEEILERLSETKIIETGSGGRSSSPQLFKPPILHGFGNAKLNRMVVNFAAILLGNRQADVELQHGDQVIIPRKTDAAMILGEASTPFAFYHLNGKTTVGDLLKFAGGVTRNADKSNIRLLKADGRILDSWITYRVVEPGDAVLVPQRIRYEARWQENLQALTPLAILINAIRR